jgi:hypothetical protein
MSFGMPKIMTTETRPIKIIGFLKMLITLNPPLDW